MAIIIERPPVPFLTDTSENTHLARSIAFHILDIFILDCKDFVSKAVQKNIARQVAAPPPLRDHGKIRQEALTSWLKEDKALSWGHDGNTVPTTYNKLVALLSEDPKHPGAGVIKSTEKWTYARVVQQMLDNGVDGFVPVSKHGYFRTALAVASKEIKKYAPDPHNADDFVTTTIAYVMQKAKIHFVPWYTGKIQRGPLARLAHHNNWLFLNHTSYPSPHASAKTSDNPSPRTTFSRIAAKDANADPYAPWSVPDSIQDMRTLWSKATLPVDWAMEHASLGSLREDSKTEYVHKTYRFVRDSYDGTNWKHHLGLVLAILITPVLPLIFYPKDTTSTVGKANGEAEVTRAIRQLPWVKPTSKNHKGVTAQKPYITMLSTALIAMMDDRSALHQYAHTNKRFGDPWTDKHGKSYPFIYGKILMELS